MRKIVLLRHGESAWNKENLFTGWTDVDLSQKGVEEAREAGVTLKQEGFGFDLVFTSVLKRAICCLSIPAISSALIIGVLTVLESG